MRLEDALKIYPPEGQLSMLDQATYEQQHVAGQVIADTLRRVFGEQIAIIRGVNQLRANAIEGSSSGYSLIRNDDLNGLLVLLRKLYPGPVMPGRPLPVPQPPE